MLDPILVRVSQDQKSVLRQLIEFYEYDFSEFNDADINDYGYYGYQYLDHYWTDSSRQAYFIMVNGRYAGFVLVNAHACLAQGANVRSIAEFFIMRKYRRRGIGQKAAHLVFDTHNGVWEVLQHGNNAASQAFWEKVIAAYTSGDYTVHDVQTEKWSGQGMIFDGH